MSWTRCNNNCYELCSEDGCVNIATVFIHSDDTVSVWMEWSDLEVYELQISDFISIDDTLHEALEKIQELIKEERRRLTDILRDVEFVKKKGVEDENRN